MKFGSYWFLAILLPRGESQKLFLTYLFACFSFSSEENNSEQVRRGAGKSWHMWCLLGKERVTKIQRATLKPSALHEDVCRLHGSSVCHSLRLSSQTLEVRCVGAQHHGCVRSQRVLPCLFNSSGEGAAAQRVTATQSACRESLAVILRCWGWNPALPYLPYCRQACCMRRASVCAVAHVTLVCLCSVCLPYCGKWEIATFLSYCRRSLLHGVWLS